MTIKATLSKDQFVRLSILRHIQRKMFYFYVATGAALSAYGFVYGPSLLVWVAWIPFLFYLAPAIIGAYQTDPDHPLFQPTTYRIDKAGLGIETPDKDSLVEWEYFKSWRVITQCYVLFLEAGPVIAIPQNAVRPTQRAKFEMLLDKYIAAS